MDYYQFESILDEQLQNMILSNPAELHAIAKARRDWEHDEHKSNLRKDEMVTKARLKWKYEGICVVDNATVQQVFNDFGQLIAQNQLWGCRIEKVEGYKLKGKEKQFWSVTIVEKNSGIKVQSPLYGESELKSISKLRTTLLVKYCTDDTRFQSVAWKWMQKTLLEILGKIQLREIPFSPGWYKRGNKWTFWTAANEPFLANNFVNRFTLEKYDSITVDEAIDSLLNYLDKSHKTKLVGVLLDCHLFAFLGRLVEDSGICAGITLVGDNAEKIGRTFLCTMRNDVDTVNLGIDRIEKIYEKIAMLQDTPLICIVPNLNDRTMQNRMDKIMGCMQTGYIDGKRISILFVFIMKYFSKFFPLDDTIVIDTSKMDLVEDTSSFLRFQHIVITEIETAGTYWGDELLRTYKIYENKNEKQVVAIIMAINDIVLKMFDVNRIGEQKFSKLKELLRSGENEIKHQLYLKTGILTEVFCDSLKELVDSGYVSVVRKDEVPADHKEMIIYYDEKCYYFVKEVLQMICDEIRIDCKSILSIKQQLVEQNFAKIWHTGGSHRELEIDFLICSSSGQRKTLTGFAVLRSFFDVIGGINLYERGI